MAQGSVQNADSRPFVRRIERHLEKSLQSFIDIGQVLIEAEKQLGRKRWLDMVSDELPFTRRTAEKLVKIASDARITDPGIRQKLPPHWTSLHELTQLTDDEFKSALSENKIRPEMERKDVSLLRTSVTKKSTGKAAVASSSKTRSAPKSQQACTATVVPDDRSDTYSFALGVVRLARDCGFSSISLSRELLEATTDYMQRHIKTEMEDILQHTAEEDVDYLEDIFFQFETGKKFIDTSGQRHKERDIRDPAHQFESIDHLYDYCLTGRFLTKYTPLKFLDPRAYFFGVAIRTLDPDNAVRTAALTELKNNAGKEPLAAELLELFS